MPGAANVLPIAPTAPVPEFLVSDLISRFPDSGIEATELRLLLVVLVDGRGVGMSAGSDLEEKRLSKKERRKRFAPSCGIASFSVMYDLPVMRRC